MHLRLMTFLLLAVVWSLPATGQSFDLFVRGAAATSEGATHVHGGAATVELNDGRGIEAGVEWFSSPAIGFELSASSVRHDLFATAFGEHPDLGGTRVTPVAAILQFHSSHGGRFDLHAGGGAAFVHLTDLSNNDELQLLGVQSIRFHDRVAPVVEAGLDFRLGDSWSLTVDGKYFAIRSATTATYLDGSKESADLHLNHVVASAGVTLHF